MKTLFLLCLGLLVLAACNKKDDSSGIVTGGNLSTAELVGSASSACTAAPTILGTAYTAMSVMYSITVLADETFNYSVGFYDSANCAPGSAGYQYTQFGVLTAIGASTAVSGATNFTLTLGAAVLTPRNVNWQTRLNANCSFTGFAIGTSKNMAGVSCSSVDASQYAVSWPASGTVIYNSFTLSSGTPHVLRMNISAGDTYSAYKFGGPGYPASLTTDLSY